MNSKPYVRTVSLKEESIPETNSYPFNIPAVKALEALEFHSDVTFLVGENGTGKSTLIEGIALALGFGIEGGTKNVQISTHKNASSLHQYLRVSKGFRKPLDYYFLRAESYYNVATYLEEIDRGRRPSLHECSHGEAFLMTLTQRLKGRGLYLLDEPEAALSPSRQLAAMGAIHRLVEQESQFIIATHSPILLAYPFARIYQLGESGIRTVRYEETESFQVTHRFLNDYHQMTQEVLKMR